MTDSKGAIHVIKQATVRPLIGELHEEVPIRNHVEKKYINLVNGTEINQTSSVGLFGKDPFKNASKNASQCLRF